MSGSSSLAWGFFLAASLSVTIVLVAFVAALVIAQRQRIKLRREQATLVARAHDAERVGVAGTLERDVLYRVGAIRSAFAELRESLGLVPGSPAEVRFHALDKELEDVSVSAHLLASRLHPKIVDQIGLPMALQALTEEVQRDSGLEVRFEAEGAPPRLDAEVARAAYRIAQDALRNVVTHSKAKLAVLAIEFADGSVTLRVTDDGAGFDPAHVTTGGVGIMTMRELAISVGGRATVESDAGIGTVVEAVLPAVMR